MEILLFCTDAFGGRGGIAAVNRDLCRALTAPPLGAKVTALPRVPPSEAVDDVPARVEYRSDVAGPPLSYAKDAARATLGARRGAYACVLCTHLNLVPVAYAAARWHGSPLLLLVHGIEAWTPPDRALARLLAPRADAVAAVSRHTLDRFRGWADVAEARCAVIPNAVDLDAFSPGPKPAALLDRYALHDQTVLFTLSRLSADEQYKGHDEVLEILPTLAEDVPDVAYLIGGDGDDRPRLERKAERLGVDDRVVFSGYVPEPEKGAHYRLADAFVMPGRGEGFGIVYLEALASGIPVVASTADASREAVRGGQLGAVVDPDDPADVRRGIRAALARERGTVPDGLTYFSQEAFRTRWQRAVRRATEAPTTLSGEVP